MHYWKHTLSSCSTDIVHYCTTGGDRRLFGDASYQLGLAFITNGDPQTALMVRDFRHVQLLFYFYVAFNAPCVGHHKDDES